MRGPGRIPRDDRHWAPPQDVGLLRVPAPTNRRALRYPGPLYGEEAFNTSPAAHLAHRGVLVVEGIYPPSYRNKPRPYNQGDEENTFGKDAGVMVENRKMVWLTQSGAPWSKGVWRAVKKTLLQLRLMHPVHHFKEGHTLLRTLRNSKPQHIHQDFVPGGHLFNRWKPVDGCYLYPISVLIATSPAGAKLGLRDGTIIECNQWDAFVFRGDLEHFGEGYKEENLRQHFYVGCGIGGRRGKYVKFKPRTGAVIVKREMVKKR